MARFRFGAVVRVRSKFKIRIGGLNLRLGIILSIVLGLGLD